MNIKSIRGWIRLGAVLSVLWLIGFWTYSAILYQQATPFHETWLFDQVPDESQPVTIEQGHKLVPVKPALRVSPFLVASLLPIASGWLLVTIIVFTIIWVRRGFQDEKPHKE